MGNAITFGAHDSSSGGTAQAGIYTRSDGSYGTKMYFGTTDSYATGSKVSMAIDHAGNVTIPRGSLTASGDVTAYSDDSLKTNVQTIDGALDRVSAVRGVTFDRITDGSTSVGVIAQELEQVLPEAVHMDAEGVRHVAYGNISGLLIEAVKELKDLVETQAAEIQSLKNM